MKSLGEQGDRSKIKRGLGRTGPAPKLPRGSSFKDTTPPRAAEAASPCRDRGRAVDTFPCYGSDDLEHRLPQNFPTRGYTQAGRGRCR